MKQCRRLTLVLVLLSAWASVGWAASDAQTFQAQVELRIDGKGRLVVLVDDPAQGKADTVERAVFYTTENGLAPIAVKRLDNVRVSFVGDGVGIVRDFSAVLPDGSSLVQLTMDGRSFYVMDGKRTDLPPPIALTVVGGGSLRDRSDTMKLAASLVTSGGADPTFDEVVPEQYVTVRQ